VQDTISRRNNTAGIGGGMEAGGGKWTRADGLLIERYNAYDNNGPGIWLDIENINVTIRDSALHHNYSLYRKDGSAKIDGIGMFLEISGVVGDDHGRVLDQGPILAENNLIYDNERQGVLVYATQNVTLRNNVFANNDVDFKDQRPAPYENRDVRIVNNQFQNARITADDYTAAGGWKKKHFEFDANVFDNLDGRVYRWGNDSYNSMSKLRAQLGFETAGSRGTVTFEPLVVEDSGTSAVA
jgi:parallel beta-helix repeat protein